MNANNSDKPANYTGQLIDDINRELEDIALLSKTRLAWEASDPGLLDHKEIRRLGLIFTEAQGQKAEQAKMKFTELMSAFEVCIATRFAPANAQSLVP